MRNRFITYLITCTVGLLCFTGISHAQFKEDIYAQDPNIKPSAAAKADTTAKMFSFKEYFGGLAHKNKMKIGTMFAGSVVLPGTAQIYNKQYWKLPIVYGGIGALAGTGGYYLHQYNKSGKTDIHAKNTGTWLMVGAGLVYWGSMMDGVASYKTAKEPHPGRATLYSALLPGLGQIYNGEYFKVPIYWGCLLGAAHFWVNNNPNYVRYKRIHNEATTDPNYSQGISGETAKWYRDEYRRYRDYSILATVAFYLLQVIDANVFAYMHDFEVTDDLTMNVSPTVILPYNEYAMNTPVMNGSGSSAVGMRIGFTF